MRAETLAAVIAVATSAILAPSAARAFCRTRTVAAPSNFDPSTSSSGCFDQGLPLYHGSQCVPYRLLVTESSKIPNATLGSSLARAFDTWTSKNSSCSPGLTAIELAPTAETKIVDYKTGERGHNVIGVVDGPWPHGDGGDTLSLATLTFNSDTGEIYDADVEVRSDVGWSFTTATPANGYDFDSVITHEIGHFLGLAHSSLPEATMFASYAPGTNTQRVLAPDDALGICAIYPDRQSRATGTGLVQASPCNLAPGAPGAPGAPACGDPVITRGCSVSTGAGQVPRREGERERSAMWLVFAGAIGGALFRARARERERERERERAE